MTPPAKVYSNVENYNISTKIYFLQLNKIYLLMYPNVTKLFKEISTSDG
jgi:hypothetical protein